MQRFIPTPIVALRAGSKADQGRLLFKLLRSFDFGFTLLMWMRPRDERLRTPGVVLVRGLVARYRGEALGDQRAEQLVDEFMALADGFVHSLNTTWGPRPGDDMAWAQRLGDQLSVGNEEMLANFAIALRGTPFTPLLYWLRHLLASEPDLMSKLMPLLASASNEYSAARAEAAVTGLAEKVRSGGRAKARQSLQMRQKILAQYDQWQTGNHAAAGFLKSRASDRTAITIDETQFYRWLRERAADQARIAQETDQAGFLPTSPSMSPASKGGTTRTSGGGPTPRTD